MNTLALLGGDPLIKKKLQPYVVTGREELEAVKKVMKKGVFSAYIAAAGDSFMGGEGVKEFEQKAADFFGVRHAIAVNSWTSGLICAVGATGIEPGEEIITTPWTMSATATSILHWNAIPVFADIDSDTFNIDPLKVEKLINERTRAILAVDIFGQSADMKALHEIAEKYNLKLISDCAQSPGALYKNNYAGTQADIGGFSLNYHKHIHCGEGGILVTNDDYLARKLCLIRNHAEAVIDSNEAEDLSNMLGYNFRMGEIEAAIATSQLNKLQQSVKSRQDAAKQLNEGLQSLRGIDTPLVGQDCTHAYYVYGLKIDLKLLGVSRNKIVQALKAEGVPALMEGYANIHRLPLFKNKIAYGIKGFPWTSSFYKGEVDYELGSCPIAEDLHQNTFLGVLLTMFDFNKTDTSYVIEAFHKVWSNIELLRKL